jgi:hypothetical protein
MDANLFNTLISRRDELRKELVHIEGLIKIYQGIGIPTKKDSPNEPRMKRTKFNKRRTDVKSQVINLIKGFGEEFYVADLTKALEEKEPNKDHKLISNKARNYIHILKKEGVISGRLVDGNKYVYKLINK